MILKNSGNSISLVPSSSTDAIIALTSSRFSANPSPISGTYNCKIHSPPISVQNLQIEPHSSQILTSSSSSPIEPPPSASKELNHFFSFLISSSVKSNSHSLPKENEFIKPPKSLIKPTSSNHPLAFLLH